jgi:phosphoglycolate phosphatase-like HAD superfamily hydrolase
MKAVLWDVDGTLADSYLLGYACTLKILEKNSITPISEEIYHHATKYTTPARMAWHATGNADPNSIFGIRLGQEFDDLYIKQVSVETAPFYSGIHDLLSSLINEYNGLRFGAISNACSEYVKAVLEVNQVSDQFQVMIGADQVAVGKPSPLGLIHCSKHLDIPHTHCIYVGDSPTDGQAATAAGMVSVGVTWGSYSLETIDGHFTHIVTTVDDLVIKLRELLDGMSDPH